MSQALECVPSGAVDRLWTLSRETFKTEMDKALSKYTLRTVSTSVENCNENLDWYEWDVEAPGGTAGVVRTADDGTQISRSSRSQHTSA